MQTFPGGVFDKRLDGGRAGAELGIDQGAIHAETHHGEHFELAAERCHVELGGASGRMWFCRSPDRSLTLYSEALGFGDALGTLPALASTVQGLRRRRRAEARRGGLFLLGAVALLAALAAGGYQALRYASRAAVSALPTEADHRIGKMAIASLNLGGPVVKAQAITVPISKLLMALQKRTDGAFDFHLQVVQAATPNAFSLPGGELVVHTGLLRHVATADAMAGVIAHEMAHVSGRHGIGRIAQSLGLWGALDLLLGDLGGLSTLAVELLRSGALTKYSREQEHAADAYAVTLLQAAGFDPAGLAQLLKALQEAPSAGSGAAIPWLSSHPALEERIARVQQRAASLGPAPTRAPTLDWSAVRNWIEALPPEDPDAN